MIQVHKLAVIPRRFQTAAKLAVTKILEQPNVIGFVLAGSVAQGTSDEHSDLDFYVVTDGQQRWRLCWILDGISVEVFFNPFGYLRLHLGNDAAGLHILATGIAVLEHPELEKLQNEARELLSRSPKAQGRATLEFDRFNTMECVFDMRSVIGKQSYGFLMPQALDFIVKALYRKNRWWEVKPKLILDDLEHRSPKLARLVSLALKGESQNIQQIALETLALEIVNPLQQIEFSSDPQTV